MTVKNEVQALAVTQKLEPEAQLSLANDYAHWFEKISLNTLIWQLIVLLVIFSFRAEIKNLLKGVISKLPQLKAVGSVEFVLSQETEMVIEQNSGKLQKEVNAYQEVSKTDPNIVFLTIYIDMESALLELYSFAFPNDGATFLQAKTKKLIKNLIEGNVLTSDVQNIHDDIRPLRNRIAHGEKPLRDLDEAQPYLKALLLLKDKISDALKDIIKKGVN
jgi:hypothetical protein